MTLISMLLGGLKSGRLALRRSPHGPRGGELVALEQDGDNVRGWLSANQVLVFLNWVAGAEHSLDDLNRFLCQELEESKE